MVDDAKRQLELLRKGRVQIPEAWQPTPEVGEPDPGPAVRPYAERRVLDDQEADLLVSMTFTSRSSNATPHIVTIDFAGTPHCTCRATNPCWAIKGFCMAKGIPLP